ncbi:hypothetical protein ACFY4C_11585 [Actinomadura viridis]|uniref:hypothetical protein n=1 Tax=Actinomadura viridis TaxID=58110 RepID=UPI0036B72B2A
MAPPQFPIHPSGPAGSGRPGIPEARYGAGRGQDPGYLASLRSGTVLGRLRARMLVLVLAQPPILAISPLIVRAAEGRFGGAVPWLYVPLVLSALLAVAAGPRTPRPMAAGLPPERAAELALLQFRQAVLVRYGLAQGVILLGLPLAMAGGSDTLYLTGFSLGYPLLLGLALPTAGTVERIRARLETGGAESHLWAALLAPAAKG